MCYFKFAHSSSQQGKARKQDVYLKDVICYFGRYHWERENNENYLPLENYLSSVMCLTVLASVPAITRSAGTRKVLVILLTRAAILARTSGTGTN